MKKIRGLQISLISLSNKMKNLKLYLVFILVFLYSCDKGISPFSRTVILMDTFVSITVYDEDKKPDYLNPILDEAFGRIEDIDKLMSAYSDSSTVSVINNNSGKKYTEINEELEHIIKRGIEYSVLTGGAFDVTIFPLMKIWNILSDSPVVPSENTIKEKLDLTGCGKIKIDEKKAFLEIEGMGIDLGGISKGYAIDKSLSYLISQDIRKVVIDAGGDLGIYIDDKDSANVQVRHPREEGDFWGNFKVKHAGIATSGDYQRFFSKDGVRYHHIIDPQTGYPGRKSVSVTIVTDSAEKADALATAVFIMGPEEGMKLIEKLEGVEGVILFFKKGQLDSVYSEGMRKLYNYQEKPYIE